ncbi:MAG: NUDIX hydrolase [Planctomycetaceae bacterium]
MLGQPHGPWRVLKTSDVYSDPWMHVTKDDVVRPDGKHGTYSVLRLKPGVCVLAVQDDSVYLTEEFHYAVGRVTLEAVSGGRDDDEPAIECAKRELQEELGVQAGTWTELGVVDPFTASVVSPTALFVATDLTFGQPAQEGTEQIRCVRLSVKETYDAVRTGRITHAPSCIAILRYWIDRLQPSAPVSPL